MRRVFFICVLVIATGATGLRAQSVTTSETNPYHLSDTIVVTANRLVCPVRTIASSITVITAEQIEKTQATMVSDLLRTVPGISVVQAGGSGQQTSLFMRGANSEHTLVLINGVEINDPSSPNRAANLAHLPVDNIERIEILRGPQSVLYGSDAVAGVIQIFTKRGLGKPTVSFSSESGSFNTFREHLAIRAGRDDVDYSLMISRRDSDGTSAASARRGNHERDGYNNTMLSASFGLRPSEFVEMRFFGRLTDADADLDKGGGILDDPNYVLESKERFFSTQFSHRPVRSVWSHLAGFYITHYKRSATDFVDGAHPYDFSETEYEGRCVKFDWQHVLKLKDIGRLTVGIESERDEMEQSLFFAGMFGDYYSAVREVSAHTTGLYALNEFDMANRWFTTVGARWDDHSQFGSKATYRITSAYLLDQLGLKLRATYGTSFKAPSLVQLHDKATGNPDLLPETSEGWEIGIEKQLAQDKVALGVTYFHTGFTDLIQFDGVMDNVASAAIRGGEVSGEWKTTRMSIRVDYTNTLTRDDVDPLKQSLLRRPRHKVSLCATGDIIENLTLSLKATHKGKRADMDFSTWPGRRVELIDYTVVDLGATYRLSPAIELRARIENLLDAEYEEVLYFGSAPVSAFFGFSLSH